MANDDDALSLLFPFAYFVGGVGSVAGTILALVYGILALVPAGPFEHQDVTLGVVLIVLSVIGVAGLGGFCGGGIGGLVVYAVGYAIIRLLGAIFGLCRSSKKQPPHDLQDDQVYDKA